VLKLARGKKKKRDATLLTGRNSIIFASRNVACAGQERGLRSVALETQEPVPARSPQVRHSSIPTVEGKLKRTKKKEEGSELKKKRPVAASFLWQGGGGGGGGPKSIATVSPPQPG